MPTEKMCCNPDKLVEHMARAEVEHQLLTKRDCKRSTCVAHDKYYNDVETATMSSIMEVFTPEDSDESENEDPNDCYVRKIHALAGCLADHLDPHKLHRLVVNLPHYDRDIFITLSADPDNFEPRKRLSFSLKIFAKYGPQDEDQDEETEAMSSEDNDSESDEIHGTRSGNDLGEWK